MCIPRTFPFTKKNLRETLWQQMEQVRPKGRRKFSKILEWEESKYVDHENKNRSHLQRHLQRHLPRHLQKFGAPALVPPKEVPAFEPLARAHAFIEPSMRW